MEPRDDRYNSLGEYARKLHEKNKKRVKVSGIVLILLPIFLELIRLLTGSDKTVFLIIWILCMFAISAYLVSIEYMDHTIRSRFGGVDENDALISSELRNRLRRKEETNEKHS